MIRRLLVATAALSALTLGACASTSEPMNNAVAASSLPTAQPATYLRGSAPFEIPSMLAPGFECLNQEFNQARPIRVAVSRITDTTGKISYEAAQGGTIVSQGGTEMVMSALGHLAPNIQQVERYDTMIMTTEIEMGKQRLLGPGNGSVDPLMEGQYLATDYYITGSITAAEGNIRSGGFGVNVNGIGVNSRHFVMSITTDLRLVRTRDGAVVATSSGTKQVVGTESHNGAFSFLGDYLLDIEFGEKNQEALQLGVRTALEYDLIKMLPYAIQSAEPRRCLNYVDGLFASAVS